MSHRPNRLEPIVFKVRDLRRPAIHLFMRDGEMCPDERAFLARLDETHEHLADAYADRCLADYIDRGGDLNSAYGKRLAANAGKRITSIDEVRTGKKIVAFPTAGDEAG